MLSTLLEVAGLTLLTIAVSAGVELLVGWGASLVAFGVLGGASLVFAGFSASYDGSENAG